MRSVRLVGLAGVILVLSLGWGASAHAAEFRSVGDAPAILYDTPSQKGRKLFVAPRAMPVEIVQVSGDWIKVRDAAGSLAWTEAKALTSQRQVVVTASNARIRATGNDLAPIVFTAEKGVLLELSDSPASGWLRVRHRDGESGYVKASEVWGE